MNLLAFVAISQAGVLVDITLPSEAQQAGLDEAALENELGGAIGDQLHTTDVTGYVEQMANANILSAKGLGVDYSGKMDRFAVGGGFGTAVNGTDAALFGNKDSPLPESGFAFQISLMAGLNLGFAAEEDSPAKRFKIYAHGMKATTSREPFVGTFLNYGGHFQVELAKGSEAKIGWGGLDLTTGYEFSSYSLSLSQALPVAADPVSWEATGKMSLSAAAQSVPLELSTNIHLLVATAFLGLGGDYNLSGSATADIGIKGPITLDFEGEKLDAGIAEASIQESALASSFTPRAFAGAQADILFVKIYGQVNVTLDRSFGAHAGARVVF